jgi:hypothetical protein
LYLALDRVKALAPQHPERKDKEPCASLLKGDLKGARGGGEGVWHSAGTGRRQQDKEMRDGKPVLMRLGRRPRAG